MELAAQSRSARSLIRDGTMAARMIVAARPVIIEPRGEDGDDGGGAGPAPERAEERGIEHRQQALAEAGVLRHRNEVDEKRKEERKREEDADLPGGREREESGCGARGGGHGLVDAGFGDEGEAGFVEEQVAAKSAVGLVMGQDSGG